MDPEAFLGTLKGYIEGKKKQMEKDPWAKGPYFGPMVSTLG